MLHTWLSSCWQHVAFGTDSAHFLERGPVTREPVVVGLTRSRARRRIIVDPQHDWIAMLLRRTTFTLLRSLCMHSNNNAKPDFEIMMKENIDSASDEETARLHPRSATAGSYSSWWLTQMQQGFRSCNVVTVAVIAVLVGLLLGVAFGHDGDSSSAPLGSNRAYEHQFVSEYDLIRTYSNIPEPNNSRSPAYHYTNTPMDFETAMRATGITQKEYAACNSSIYQDPNRQICTKYGNPVCYKKKLKYINDESGETVPYYTEDGAAEVACPSSPSRSSPQQWGWPGDCYARPGGTARQLICYADLPCKKEELQWTAGVRVEVKSKWYYWQGYNVGWTGGMDPTAKSPWPLSAKHEAVLSYHHEDTTDRDTSDTTDTSDTDTSVAKTESSSRVGPQMTQPYEGKFCLQKAALKALSRNGWELIEPYDAFTAETWKVIKRSPM
jgi:hypothetical protein